MKKFQDIELEIIKFDNEDVIRTSGGELDEFNGLYGEDGLWQNGES